MECVTSSFGYYKKNRFSQIHEILHYALCKEIYTRFHSSLQEYLKYRFQYTVYRVNTKKATLLSNNDIF